MMYDMSLNRRTFLLGTSLAPFAVGANDRINVAVVGVGGRGRAHVSSYGKLPEARVAAICDVNTAQTERAQGSKPKTYQDLRKLYEDKDIDAVSIATPNHWHALASISAVKAGKDVYVEKPASYNIWESQKMVEHARKSNRVRHVPTGGQHDPFQGSRWIMPEVQP